MKNGPSDHAHGLTDLRAKGTGSVASDITLGRLLDEIRFVFADVLTFAFQIAGRAVGDGEGVPLTVGGDRNHR